RGCRCTRGAAISGPPAARRAAAFSADRRWLATASDDGTIRLWRLGTVDPTSRSSAPPGPKGGLPGLAFSAYGQWLVSGGADGTVRLWRLTEEGARSGPVLGGGRYGAVN